MTFSSSLLPRFALIMGMATPLAPVIAHELNRPDAATANAEHLAARAERLTDIVTASADAVALKIAIADAGRQDFIALKPGQAKLMGQRYDDISTFVPQLLSDLNKGSDALSDREIDSLEQGRRKVSRTEALMRAAGLKISLDFDKMPLPSAKFENAYQVTMATSELDGAGFTTNPVKASNQIRTSIMAAADVPSDDERAAAALLVVQLPKVMADATRLSGDVATLVRSGAAKATDGQMKGLRADGRTLARDFMQAATIIRTVAGGTLVARNTP